MHREDVERIVDPPFFPNQTDCEIANRGRNAADDHCSKRADIARGRGDRRQSSDQTGDHPDDADFAIANALQQAPHQSGGAGG